MKSFALVLLALLLALAVNMPHSQFVEAPPASFSSSFAVVPTPSLTPFILVTNTPQPTRTPTPEARSGVHLQIEISIRFCVSLDGSC